MTPGILHYADLETAFDDPERIGRLAGLVAHRRDDETLVVGAGDNLGPGILSLVTAGRQALPFFRAVGADVETFGNHDFDHGVDALLQVVDDAPQTWCCANASLGGDRFGGAVGVEPWTVVERGDDRVGVVGVAHPETAAINPAASAVRFTDPIPAVRESVDALGSRNVDAVVVVAHLGTEPELARAVDVDVVLGGHDHDPLVERVEGTLVCRPGGDGRGLVEVDLSGAEPTATRHAVDHGSVDSDTCATLEAQMERTGLSEVVGRADPPIVCDMQACKRGESRIGNLITDAYRWQTGADVAVHDGGGFRRREPLADAVRGRDVLSVVPYDSDLCVLRVDGSTLRSMLRELDFPTAPDDRPAWHFGHLSGASIVWDEAAASLREAVVGERPLEPTATYEVATTEFFVSHDAVFPSLGPASVVRRAGPQFEAVLEYVRERGLDVERGGRIRRVNDAIELPDRDWPHTP